MITYRSTVEWINENREVVLDLVRIYLGIGLFVRGILFISESQGLETLVDLSEFSVASAALAHYVSFAHLLGGLMLAAGLLTRLAALIQIPILVGAVFLVHLQEGLMSPTQSLEFSALVLFLLMVVFVFGAGRWSADRYVFEYGPAVEDQEPEIWWRDDDFDTRDPIPPIEERQMDEPVPVGETAGSGVQVTATQASTERVEMATCACGHHLSHPRVTAEPRYGWSAGFFFMLGISAPVKEVLFYCEQCGTIMNRTRDPQIRRKYRWHTS